MNQAVIPSTNSELEELTSILCWKVGTINVQLGRNGKKIEVGSIVVYRAINVSTVFVCRTEIFLAETKHRKNKFHEQIERARANNTLISKSFIVPISTVKPIEKPAD